MIQPTVLVTGATGKTGPNQDSVVRLRGVAKTYRVGSVDVEALRGVTLDIHKSRFSAVIGRAFTFSSGGHYDAQFV